MAEKVTKMVLTVDLQCCKCYKRVKKLLCRFPQIQDQEFDEKNNKVTIKVVCCSPEKIRDQLRCKGRGCIIEIIIVLTPPRTPPPTPPRTPPPPLTINIKICCTICCEGGCRGPCYNPCYCYRRSVRCCCGCCGKPVWDSWCGGCGCGGCCGCRCEMNSQNCMTM